MDHRKIVADLVAQAGTMNYVHKLKKRRDLVAIIEEASTAFSDRPFKDKVYAYINDDSPICENGNVRSLRDIESGWVFCGKGTSCACLNASRSSKIKKTLAAKRKQVSTVELTDAAGIATLTDLIANNPRNYTSLIFDDPDLTAWVKARSATLPDDAKLSEKCYVALHGMDELTCPKGRIRKFYSIVEGYENCCRDNSHCACRNEAHSQMMTEHQANLSDEEKQRRIDQQVETMIERYGVANTVDVPEFKEKMRATLMENYGVENPFQSATIRERASQTLMESYGVATPWLSDAIQAKARATKLERYGVEHTMTMAREAFTEQTGYENPFQHPDVMEKIEETMRERYGVAKPLQSREIFEAMRESLMLKYGVDHVMKLQSVKDALRSKNMIAFGRPYQNQAHFSDESYAIINDPIRFKDLFEGRSLRDVAAHLGMAYDTTRKYCYKHGVELPKSSYETAIRDYVASLGIEKSDILSGNRRIIKPYELDIVVESRKLAIEFNGLYFHRDSLIAKSLSGDALIESKSYHRNKLLLTEAAGYRLITIFEDEWVHKQEIVKSRIAHALGLSPRGPGARSCKIEPISCAVAKDFLDQYHIQAGGPYGFANYGAFHDGALIAVMTFSKGRLGVGTGRLELLRFATNGRSIPGIANRLFKRFVRDHDPDEVVSYADRRWSQGDLYRKLGFKEESNGSPGYFYIDFKKVVRFHRMKAQKNKIVHLVEDGHNMTEKEIMLDLGYEIIYDCGSYLFSWQKTQ